jgi:hypothetical protein
VGLQPKIFHIPRRIAVDDFWITRIERGIVRPGGSDSERVGICHSMVRLDCGRFQDPINGWHLQNDLSPEVSKNLTRLHRPYLAFKDAGNLTGIDPTHHRSLGQRGFDTSRRWLNAIEPSENGP